jgi:hypothetical protein
VTPTNKIIQGKWKLSEEDKYKALELAIVIKELLDLFTTPKPFIHILNKSIDTSILVDKFSKILSSFDIQSPSLDQIVVLYESVFRKLSIADSIADSIISKNDAGPLRDSENNLIS